MDKVLLDADMLSEITKGKNVTVTATADQYREALGKFTISTITVMEVVKGLHKRRRTRRLEEFLNAISADEILPFDLPCAGLAGKIFADLERAGQTIGRADPMIASIAIHHSLPLATGNSEHYQRIQTLGYQLRLVNWRE
jgi:tRNA(fMet)-specific endonuclease VapC